MLAMEADSSVYHYIRLYLSAIDSKRVLKSLDDYFGKRIADSSSSHLPLYSFHCFICNYHYTDHRFIVTRY